MSSEEPPQSLSSDGDLIDLSAGASLPPAPEIPPSPEPTNLLDSELPDLEEKLKSSTTFPPIIETPKTCVDVEDILITLDDDELDSNNEALSVLMKLDDLLEASLLESNQILKSYTEEETVELDECLYELDNYLNSCDCEENVRSEAFNRNTPQRATFSTHLEPKQPVLYHSLRGTASVVVDMPSEMKIDSSPWLRSSMRRLQHLRLPSDVEIETARLEEVVVATTPVVAVNNSNVRPVSAPSVLMQRERQDEGEVVERSCSTSSRSRRPRSVSSVSSFGSSVDSTASCTPEPTPQRNGQQEQHNPTNARR